MANKPTADLPPGNADLNKVVGKRERTTMRYAVVIEKAPLNYAAYVPDLPGCLATGATVAETESLIREAIEFHLEGIDVYSHRVSRNFPPHYLCDRSSGNQCRWHPRI